MGKGYNGKVARGEGCAMEGGQMKVGTAAELHNDTGLQGETDTKGSRSQEQMRTMARCPKGHTRKRHKGRGSQG